LKELRKCSFAVAQIFGAVDFCAIDCSPNFRMCCTNVIKNLQMVSLKMNERQTKAVFKNSDHVFC
jgi:cell fate regulator YaaT (PSP1 superfamily)